MLSVITTLKGIKKAPPVKIDNTVFALHYKLSVAFLIAFSVLFLGKQFLEDQIECVNSGDGDSTKAVCWNQGTFSMPIVLSQKVDELVAHQNLDKTAQGEDIIYHYIYFVLIFQAVCFYLPRFLWIALERGIVRKLVLGLNAPILADDVMVKGVEQLVKFLRLHKMYQGQYVSYYVLCEALNFANDIGQICAWNRLAGEFTRYKIKVLEFSETDFVLQSFPTTTNCTVHRRGPSGDVQKHDALCVLSLNVIYENTYNFLWIWFVVLAVLSGLTVSYRIGLIFVSSLRCHVLRSKASLADRNDVQVVCKHLNLGGWFIINLLSKNIDPINLGKIFKCLCASLEGKPKLLEDDSVL